MKPSTICFNKRTGYLVLFVAVILFVAGIVIKSTSNFTTTRTSTSAKASEVEDDDTPSAKNKLKGIKASMGTTTKDLSLCREKFDVKFKYLSPDAASLGGIDKAYVKARKEPCLTDIKHQEITFYKNYFTGLYCCVPGGH